MHAAKPILYACLGASKVSTRTTSKVLEAIQLPIDFTERFAESTSYRLDSLNTEKNTPVAALIHIHKTFLKVFFQRFFSSCPSSLEEREIVFILSVPFFKSARLAPFVFSFCCFVCFPHGSYSSQKQNGATGFLLLHIVLLHREVSLFLMSSASVALSPRQSTTDLLAFASLLLSPVSLSPPHPPPPPLHSVYVFMSFLLPIKLFRLSD